MPQDGRTFFQLITDAIADLEQYGYDNPDRLEGWIEAIRAKLAETMPSVGISAEKLSERLRAEYERLVTRGAIRRDSPAISLFTLERIKPDLRAELDRRILASAALIRLNRAAAVEKTLQRFSGWATSIPAGGSKTIDKQEVKTTVRKALAQLPYEERRVAIDQGHKLVAAITETVAVGSNAIAAAWHSKWQQRGYDYREDHKERDGKVYAIRGSWALERGLINAGDGYTDDMTKAGEEVNCRCQCRYIFALRGIPPYMLTDKGRDALAHVKDRLASQLVATPPQV